ncbi:MAG TPA: hypothetical protein VL976_16270 [Xanthobacteraceae bacterium]|nr:hypothetical protein [Xanthobacteraceae bacterium]
MTGKTITIALAFLAGATSTALPQSQRNFGPNGPSSYGCYGEAYTGTAASNCPGAGPGPSSQYLPYQQYPGQYQQYPQSQYPQRPQWQWQRLY